MECRNGANQYSLFGMQLDNIIKIKNEQMLQVLLLVLFAHLCREVFNKDSLKYYL